MNITNQVIKQSILDTVTILYFLTIKSAIGHIWFNVLKLLSNQILKLLYYFIIESLNIYPTLFVDIVVL